MRPDQVLLLPAETYPIAMLIEGNRHGSCDTGNALDRRKRNESGNCVTMSDAAARWPSPFNDENTNGELTRIDHDSNGDIGTSDCDNSDAKWIGKNVMHAVSDGALTDRWRATVRTGTGRLARCGSRRRKRGHSPDVDRVARLSLSLEARSRAQL